MSGTNESWVVWLSEKGTSKGSQRSFIVRLANASRSAACAEDRETASTISNQQRIFGFSFSSIPRRNRKMYLQIYTTAQKEGAPALLGEFKLPNPLYQRYPTWEPEPFPIVKTNGNLSVSCTRIYSNVKFNAAGKIETTTDLPWMASCAFFSIYENGKPTADWQPQFVRLLDATGNSGTPWALSRHNRQDETLLSWASKLWSDESAWQLRVEFSKISGFSADEVWTIQNIVVTNLIPATIWLPKSPLRKQPHATKHWFGSTVDIFLRQGLEIQPPKKPYLEVYIEPTLPNHSLSLVKVTDHKGQALMMAGGPIGNDMQTFKFESFNGAESLSIIVALHENRSFEFRARPEKK